MQHKARKYVSPNEKSITSTSSVLHKYLNKEKIVEKLNNAQYKKHQYERKIMNLEARINSLVKKVGVEPSEDLHESVSETLIQNFETLKEVFPEGSSIRLLFEQQVKQGKLKSAKQMKWHPIVIRWCMGLYHTSPAAYDFIKRSSFLALPHKTTLLDYSIYTTPKSGFNCDVIERLYQEINCLSLKPHQKNVSLLFDEMKVKSNLVYSSSTGKLIGFVELGSINDEIHNLEKSCSDEENKENDIATHILAFMVRGIFTNLQFAFAFFPCTGFTCAQLFPCVWEAVSVLEALDLQVRCFISDGASPNRTFYRLHGQPGEVPYFAINLCSIERKIYLICDTPHLMKTVRNNWENLHGNKNTRNLLVSACLSVLHCNYSTSM